MYPESQSLLQSSSADGTPKETKYKKRFKLEDKGRSISDSEKKELRRCAAHGARRAHLRAVLVSLPFLVPVSAV